MCFIIRIEERRGLFKGYFRMEDIIEAHRLYNHLIEHPIQEDTVVKMLDSRLNILKSSIAQKSKEKSY